MFANESGHNRGLSPAVTGRALQSCEPKEKNKTTSGIHIRKIENSFSFTPNCWSTLPYLTHISALSRAVVRTPNVVKPSSWASRIAQGPGCPHSLSARMAYEKEGW